MKKLFLVLILFFVAVLFRTLAHAETVSLAWDPNSESNLAGYKLYYSLGVSGGPYDGVGAYQGDSPITINLSDLEEVNVPFYTLTGLGYGTYYFVLTAFDSDGLESYYSEEVFKTFMEIVTADPPQAPTGLEIWE